VLFFFHIFPPWKRKHQQPLVRIITSKKERKQKNFVLLNATPMFAILSASKLLLDVALGISIYKK